MPSRATSSTMARYAALLFALAVSLIGCYSPDEPPLTVATGACAPDGDLCSVNGDCCMFDGSSRSGAALCVDYGETAECTGICYADGDCEAGCCGALVDTQEYGVCGPCSTNPFEPEPAGGPCLQGVEFFCSCGDALGVPCGSDRALFEANCTSGESPADTFACWAGYSTGACQDALDSCS